MGEIPQDPPFSTTALPVSNSDLVAVVYVGYADMRLFIKCEGMQAGRDDVVVVWESCWRSGS